MSKRSSIVNLVKLLLILKSQVRGPRVDHGRLSVGQTFMSIISYENIGAGGFELMTSPNQCYLVELPDVVRTQGVTRAYEDHLLYSNKFYVLNYISVVYDYVLIIWIPYLGEKLKEYPRTHTRTYILVFLVCHWAASIQWV